MSCKNKTQIPTRHTKSYFGYYKLSYREFGTAIPNKKKGKGKKTLFFLTTRHCFLFQQTHTHQSLFKRACLASLRLPFKATLSLFLSGETTQLQWRRFRFRATRTSQVSSEQVKWRRTQPEEWSNRASFLLRVSALHIPTLFAVMPSSPSASPSFPESMTYRSFRSLYTEP